MVNIFYDSYRILNKVYGEKAFLKQAIKSEIIEPINRAAVIKICYGVLDEDIALGYYVSLLCDKNPKLPVRIILKISLYNIIYLNKAPYAVTNSAVELLKKLGKGGASGFLNAVLRKFVSSRDKFALPCGNDVKSVAIRYSYPEFLVKELINDYGVKTAEQIMGFKNPRTFLRFNTDEDGEKYLTEKGLGYEKLPFKGSFALKNFVRDDKFFDGLYTFQSVGSVAVAETVGSGENLLDCCAAPGGKSVLLSQKFKSVTACDIHPHRVELIKDYCARMNAANVTAVQKDATEFCEEFYEKFDAVLCDCPCSGTGVIPENPDIKLNRESDSINELCDLQVKILKNCFKYVKKGGYLYYSTCSVLRRENDGSVLKFLSEINGTHPEKSGAKPEINYGENALNESAQNKNAQNGSAKRDESAQRNKNLQKRAEIKQITSPLNHVKTECGLQFLPQISAGAGFYVCKILKLD